MRTSHEDSTKDKTIGVDIKRSEHIEVRKWPKLNIYILSERTTLSGCEAEVIYTIVRDNQKKKHSEETGHRPFLHPTYS